MNDKLMYRCGMGGCIGALVFGGAVASASDFPTRPIRVTLETVATGFSGFEPNSGAVQFAPTKLVDDGTGRQFVATLGGLVRLIEPDGTVQATPFLNTNAFTNAERIVPSNFGMTSIALHPGFRDNASPGFGKFYTLTTEVWNNQPADFADALGSNRQSHQDVLTEWTVGDVNAPTFSGTSRVLMRVDQPNLDHNLVDMVFDDAGLLYVTSGDGGNVANLPPGVLSYPDNSRTLTNIFGKVLRIDPLGTNAANGQYGVPSSNPFVTTPDALPEIYSYGHRSPFRLTRDRLTGDLYLGEVGQIGAEEVNRVEAGGHYGWNFKEGSFLYDPSDQAATPEHPDLPDPDTGLTLAQTLGLTDPVFDYLHDEGNSVVGGYVYRGTLLDELEGTYVFGDFNGVREPDDGVTTGNARTQRLLLGDPVTGELSSLVIDPSEGAALLPERIYSFAEDAQGELYVLGGTGTDAAGVVLKLTNAVTLSPGDFDASGSVEQGDLDLVLANWGKLRGAWPDAQGFDTDNVDQEELDRVLTNWGSGLAPDFTANAGLVPEPGIFGLLGLGLAGMLQRRR